MGRSVSVAAGAELVTYKQFEYEEDEAVSQDNWDDFVEDITSYFEYKYPSLERCDEWLDREDHVILQNRLIYLGISEYCGLVSIWAVPKEEYPDLTAKFIKTITPYFEKIGELRKVGTFSNGEAVFKRVK